MRGIITTRDVFAQGAIIIAEFGFKTYWRCLTSIFLGKRNQTFLECVCQENINQKAPLDIK